MKPTFANFLASKGIKLETTAFVSVIDGYMRQPDIVALVDEFMSLHQADEKKDQHTTETMICVKNVDCEFNDLRDRLDKISAEYRTNFTIEKDTFVFYTTNELLFGRLEKLKESLCRRFEKTIIVEKAG